MIMTGIFIMPNLCESYLSLTAKVEKGHIEFKPIGIGVNIHNSDSVSVDYDAFTGTITISTTSDSKDVYIKIYKVKAEALSDGAISYSAPVQAESSSISSVQSTASAVNVILEGPANSGTTLRLASATGNVPVTEYSVEAGSTVCDIPADNLPSGVYQVTMVENGVIVGIKKFTK